MVTQFYPPVTGGQEQYVRNLARVLVERGHVVEVATNPRRDRPRASHPDGCPTAAPALQGSGTAARDAGRRPGVPDGGHEVARYRPIRHPACARLEHRLGSGLGPPSGRVRAADPARRQPRPRRSAYGAAISTTSTKAPIIANPKGSVRRTWRWRRPASPDCSAKRESASSYGMISWTRTGRRPRSRPPESRPWQWEDAVAAPALPVPGAGEPEAGWSRSDDRHRPATATQRCHVILGGGHWGVEGRRLVSEDRDVEPWSGPTQ